MPESAGLTAREAQRYGRHIVLPEFGPEGQRRLKGSSALVVGLGGLGVPVSVQLAAAGVGKLGLVDPDIVELSNLQRQFIFSEADLGCKKVDAARGSLGRVNPNVGVQAIDAKLTSDNVMDIAQDYDVIVDSTDTLPSRYLISDACVLLGKPDVYASVQGFEGMVSVFDAAHGPCYRCLWPEPPAPESVTSCEEAGVSSAVAGIMGAVQANQAISLLLRAGAPLVGRLLVFNGLDNTFDETKVKKSPSCPACGPDRSLTGLIDYEGFCGLEHTPVHARFEITPEELKESLEAGHEVQLIDVREPREYATCHIEGARLIPLGQLHSHLGELESGRPIVVYCHVGVRSAAATAELRRAGFAGARSLEGGIEAWAARIDPKMARY